MDKRTTGATGRTSTTAPNPALELARAASCCRAVSDLLSEWPGTSVEYLVEVLSDTFSSRTVGEYDTVIANALSTAAFRRLSTVLADVEAELRQICGIAADTFRTDDAHLTVLAHVGVPVADLRTQTLTAAQHPAATAIARIRSLTDVLTWIKDGGVVTAVQDTYAATNVAAGLDDVVAELTRSGLDAERLCWALITFETTRHVNLVWHFANKLTRTFPERDAADLFGWGWQGLRRALRTFDPDRGYQFSTYAATRIAGEIRDGVRSESPVPKRLTTYLRKVRTAEEALSQTLGRYPRVAEVAEHLGGDLDQLKLVPRLAPTASINEVYSESHQMPDTPEALIDRTGDPADAVLSMSLADAVEAALEQIPDDERLAVRLLVMEGRDPREVRELTGIDSRKMRRSKERALASLADHLRAWNDTPAA
jgi:RNA polymerase sigma factor for flagellar operon FliA